MFRLCIGRRAGQESLSLGDAAQVALAPVELDGLVGCSAHCRLVVREAEHLRKSEKHPGAFCEAVGATAELDGLTRQRERLRALAPLCNSTPIRSATRLRARVEWQTGDEPGASGLGDRRNHLSPVTRAARLISSIPLSEADRSGRANLRTRLSSIEPTIDEL